jgi:transcriptional regulator with XRE-family HTH domain
MRQNDEGSIGWRIARARKERGLTQEELATAIGVSPRSIQGYEAGKIVPYRRLSQLAEVTNRDLGWLLEGDMHDNNGADSELVQRLVSLIEEVSADTKRIRAAAERLEHLLDAPPGRHG